MGFFRFSLLFLLKTLALLQLALLFLSSCASERPLPSPAPDCSREYALRRGQRDGASGRNADFSFFRACSPATRPAALGAYRQSFEEFRPRPLKAGVEAAVELPLELPSSGPLRELGQEAWVCEVEANSKIFTGAGKTRDEALGSARSLCSSHFQASYCSSGDCKQNL